MLTPTSINGGTGLGQQYFPGTGGGTIPVIVKTPGDVFLPAPATVGTIGSVVTPIFNPVAQSVAGAARWRRFACHLAQQYHRVPGRLLQYLATTTYTVYPGGGTMRHDSDDDYCHPMLFPRLTR